MGNNCQRVSTGVKRSEDEKALTARAVVKKSVAEESTRSGFKDSVPTLERKRSHAKTDLLMCQFRSQNDLMGKECAKQLEKIKHWSPAVPQPYTGAQATGLGLHRLENFETRLRQ